MKDTRKTLKVSQEAYDGLDRYRAKGDSFTDALIDLLSLAEELKTASKAFENSPEYQNWKAQEVK